MSGWNWQKNQVKDKLHAELFYLKIIRFLYPRYDPKIIEDILKMCRKQWKWGWKWKIDLIDTTLGISKKLSTMSMLWNALEAYNFFNSINNNI